MHIVALFAFLGIFVKSIAAILVPDSLFYNRFIFQDSSVPIGYIYLNFFVLFICIGYHHSVTSRQRLKVSSFTRATSLLKRSRLLALIGFTSFTVVSLVLISTLSAGSIGAAYESGDLIQLKVQQIEGAEGFGKSFAAVKIFYVITVLCFTVYMSRYFSERRLGLLFGAFALLSLISILLKSQRIELVEIALYTCFIYIATGGKISVKFVAWGAVGSAVIVTLFAVLSLVRTGGTFADGNGLDFYSVVDQVLYSGYFLDINMPIVLIDRFDTGDVFFGASYFGWLIGWIPRSIWEGKPALALGPYVKTEVLGLWGTIGGLNPTSSGEAYLNFGYFGVVVGAALGFMYRKLEEYFLSSKGVFERFGLWLYPITVIPFVITTLQSTFSLALVAAGAKYAICLAVLTCVCHKATQRRAVRRAATKHGGKLSTLR